MNAPQCMYFSLLGLSNNNNTMKRKIAMLPASSIARSWCHAFAEFWETLDFLVFASSRALVGRKDLKFVLCFDFAGTPVDSLMKNLTTHCIDTVWCLFASSKLLAFFPFYFTAASSKSYQYSIFFILSPPHPHISSHNLVILFIINL
jgi:hypothetical protein